MRSIGDGNVLKNTIIVCHDSAVPAKHRYQIPSKRFKKRGSEEVSMHKIALGLEFLLLFAGVPLLFLLAGSSFPRILLLLLIFLAVFLVLRKIKPSKTNCSGTERNSTHTETCWFSAALQHSSAFSFWHGGSSQTCCFGFRSISLDLDHKQAKETAITLFKQ